MRGFAGRKKSRATLQHPGGTGKRRQRHHPFGISDDLGSFAVAATQGSEDESGKRCIYI